MTMVSDAEQDSWITTPQTSKKFQSLEPKWFDGDFSKLIEIAFRRRIILNQQEASARFRKTSRRKITEDECKKGNQKIKHRIQHHCYQWRWIREFFVSPQNLSLKLYAICDGVPLANTTVFVMVYSGTVGTLARRKPLIRVIVPVVSVRTSTGEQDIRKSHWQGGKCGKLSEKSSSPEMPHLRIRRGQDQTGAL